MFSLYYTTANISKFLSAHYFWNCVFRPTPGFSLYIFFQFFIHIPYKFHDLSRSDEPQTFPFILLSRQRGEVPVEFSHFSPPYFLRFKRKCSRIDCENLEIIFFRDYYFSPRKFDVKNAPEMKTRLIHRRKCSTLLNIDDDEI